jgi:hypothetical protein
MILPRRRGRPPERGTAHADPTRRWRTSALAAHPAPPPRPSPAMTGRPRGRGREPDHPPRSWGRARRRPRLPVGLGGELARSSLGPDRPPRPSQHGRPGVEHRPVLRPPRASPARPARRTGGGPSTPDRSRWPGPSSGRPGACDGLRGFHVALSSNGPDPRRVQPRQVANSGLARPPARPNASSPPASDARGVANARRPSNRPPAHCPPSGPSRLASHLPRVA